MVYEVGPILIEPLPLAPRVSQPAAFESLGAALGAFLTSGDQVLAGYSGTLAPLLSRELGSSYDSDVAPAIAALDSLDTASDAATIADVVSTVDSVISDLELVAADLPSPNDEADPPNFDPGGDPPGGDQD